MIEAELVDAVLCSIADPEAVRQAMAAGVGNKARLHLGGKLDPRFGGDPLEVEAEVLCISDGIAVRKGPYYTGVSTTFGPSCLIDVGGVRVIVATHRLQIDDREQFRIFGVDPDRTNILACKAVNHFRADRPEAHLCPGRRPGIVRLQAIRLPERAVPDLALEQHPNLLAWP